MSTEPLDQVEAFALAHSVAIDNALNVLVRALYRSGTIDRLTVEDIDESYKKSLDDQPGNPLIAQLMRLHDEVFADILNESSRASARAGTQSGRKGATRRPRG